MAKTPNRSSTGTNPQESLDYFYMTQVRELTEIRRIVANLATGRKRLELQLDSAEKDRARLAGRTSTTRPEMTEMLRANLAAADAVVQSLIKQVTQAQEQEVQATNSAIVKDQMVNAFRGHKEALKSQYSMNQALSSSGSYDPGAGRESTGFDDSLALQIGPLTDLLTLDFLDPAQSLDSDTPTQY
jgi:phage shock protein A